MQTLLPVAAPEEVGLSSNGIARWLDAVAQAGLEHHALWVLRHGKVAAKFQFAPYDDHTPHMLFSLSKSFCSAAAGFAVQEGLLQWDTKVIDVLGNKFPEEPSEWLKAITLHDLLTMGSGLKPESDNVGGEDWAKAVLACDCDHAPAPTSTITATAPISPPAWCSASPDKPAVITSCRACSSRWA